MGKHSPQAPRRNHLWGACALLVSVVSLGTWSLIPKDAATVGVGEPSATETTQSLPKIPAAPSPSPSPTPSAVAGPASTGPLPKIVAAAPPPTPWPTPVVKKPPRPAVAPTPVVPWTSAPVAAPKPTPTAAPVTGSAVTALLAYLNAQVGKPYLYGGTGPGAFDCSGLTQTAFARIGINLPRTSEEQSTQGAPVSLSALQPGDLVFWGTGPGSAYHEATYIGNGTYIAAENPSYGVAILTFSFSAPDFARRIL